MWPWQLALRLQLRADETDGHDPVLHGRPQQAAARPVPRGLVLEHHLTEPREGIADMRRVVDRQTTSAARIDVRKGAVGKLRTLLRAEPCHPRMIARPTPRTGERRARYPRLNSSIAAFSVSAGSQGISGRTPAPSQLVAVTASQTRASGRNARTWLVRRTGVM